ncbi:MAG: hypothetical protein KDI16_15370 [Halioglobus sp.]|nr:hypothetical protein [Halioglobus sp.]
MGSWVFAIRQQLTPLIAVNVFVDLRNVYERSLMERHGFSYICVGR